MGLARLSLGALLALCALPTLARAELLAGNFGPYGATLLSRPAIYWNVRATGDDAITSVEVTLDDTPVPAHYDELKGRLEAQPENPVPTGEHTVVVRLYLDGGVVFRREWRFSVLAGAFDALPELRPQQREALELVNAFRRRAGLPPLVADARLMAASQAHSEYLALNATTGHFQTEGKPGFFGTGPTERVEAFGFSEGCYEAIFWGEETLGEAIQALVDAPYHRIPFLQPAAAGAPSGLGFGAGLADGRLTLLFQLTDAKTVAVFPFDGQQDVPTAWSRRERPNPLRLHEGASPVVGYPITLTYFGSQSKLTLESARLSTDSGEEVPLYINTPVNDDWLRNTVLLIPKEPLRPGTTYVATVRASTSAGERADRTWRFSTRP